MKHNLHDHVKFSLEKFWDESDVMEGEIVEMSSCIFTRATNLVVLSKGKKYYIQPRDVIEVV